MSRAVTLSLTIGVGVGIGLAAALSSGAAATALLVGLGLIMPPCTLVLGTLATSRGFDFLLPISGGLASWLGISYALTLLAITKSVTVSERPRPTTTLVPPILAFALVGWLLLGSLPAGRVLTPPLALLASAGLVLIPALAPRCRRHILAGIVVLTLAEVLLSTPQLSERLHGVSVDDPQQLGVALLASIAVIVGQPFQWRLRRLVLLVLVVALVATRSRSIWFAGSVLLAIAIAPHLSLRRLLLILVAIATLAFVLFTPLSASLGLNLESANIRRESIANGWAQGLDAPVFGTGWERTEDATGSDDDATRSLPFNAPVFFFAVGGAGAALLFLGVLATAIRASLRFDDRIACLFLSSFAAVCVSEMALYPGSISAPLFFLFVGLASVRPSPSHSSRADVRAARAPAS